VTLVRPEQPLNAQDPILLTLFPIMTLVRLEQPLNAPVVLALRDMNPSLMSVTLLGIVRVVRLVQPANAQKPMLATLFGIVTPKFLWNNIRYAILAIFIVAAIITPSPDPWTMCIYAVPMLLLYLLGVGVSWWVRRSRG